MEFTALEVIVILLSFLIVFALLKLMRGDTLADRKREEIELKRAALISRRKAQAEAAARAKVESENQG